MEKMRVIYRISNMAFKVTTQTSKLLPTNITNLHSQKTTFSPFNTTRLSYRFCQKQSKPNKNPEHKESNSVGSQKQPNKKTEQTIKKVETKQLQKMSPEEEFNLFIGMDKNHSFKNDLVVAQNHYEKEIKQLKQAILFQDLLRKQIDILVYDTEGKPFFQDVFKTFLKLISVFGTIYFFIQGLKTDKKFKIGIEKTPEGQLLSIIVKLMCFSLFVITMFKHFRMCKRYVQKIVYHTEDQTFTFVKRKPYGKKFEEKVSRFKILYTENPVLLKRGTNYLNIENQAQYRIGYVFAWKKEDLFSHLIHQRIRT